MAAGRVVAVARVLPPDDLLSKQAHQIEIPLRVLIGFRFAHHRFAQDIHSEGDALLVRFAQRVNDFLFIISKHELPRHAGDLGLDPSAEEPRRAAGGLQSQAQGRGEVHLLLPKILLQMPRDLAGRVQGGQHIDKPKELGLEMFVLHRPIHQRAVKALLAEQRRRFCRIHQGEYLLAVFADTEFNL